MSELSIGRKVQAVYDRRFEVRVMFYSGLISIGALLGTSLLGYGFRPSILFTFAVLLPISWCLEHVAAKKLCVDVSKDGLSFRKLKGTRKLDWRNLKAIKVLKGQDGEVQRILLVPAQGGSFEVLGKENISQLDTAIRREKPEDFPIGVLPSWIEAANWGRNFIVYIVLSLYYGFLFPMLFWY
ncbi:MAG: hypothetical protein IID08_02380 [Candidatus Hydrogenedentes bacterium]|nr:hypothetical protein [Candidatus Hydrogenedentota bacterium]